jgi:hypothetical protein
MPWSGSGTYVLPPAYSPEVNGTVIDATRYNGLTTDVANGISNAIAKDGQNVPTANLPMGGFKHTGVADGNGTGQYLAYNQATAARLTSLGLGLAPASVLQVQLLNETGGGSNQGVSLVSSGATRQLNFGINNSTLVPWIQAWQPGVGGATLSIQPQGGNVGIGTAPDGTAQVKIGDTSTGRTNLIAGQLNIGVGQVISANATEVWSAAAQPFYIGTSVNQGFGFITNSAIRLNIAGTGDISASWSNTTVATRHFTLVNTNGSGQESLGFTINGTERGAVRADFVGNLNYIANGGDHYWYTGGDSGVGTARLVLVADGRLYGTALHNNAGSMTGTTNQYVGSGTYSMTPVGVSNIVSTAATTCQWMRVGNVVTVSGYADVTPNATTATTYGIPLPIASAFTNTQQGSGSTGAFDTVYTSGRIYPDFSNDRMEVVHGSMTGGAARQVWFHFTYVVV